MLLGLTLEISISSLSEKANKQYSVNAPLISVKANDNNSLK